nr:dihydropteroate synthase [Lentilactobacillus sp. Marseille-Q4993]
MDVQPINNNFNSRGHLQISISNIDDDHGNVLNLLNTSNINYYSIGKTFVIDDSRSKITNFAKHSTAFPKISHQITKIIDSSKLYFTGRNFSFDITSKPLIYSILNLTPDSFYDGGVNNSVDGVLHRIETELEQGASIFEVGGKSSKPHFDDISASEEWNRLVPYLKQIHREFPNLVLAIDSNTPEVMKYALDDGIQIINDIDGFDSKEKLNLVEQYQPSVVSMFNGRNFDEHPDTLTDTMNGFFEQNLKDLLSTGIKPENIVLDPGVGFSNHNTLTFDMIKM